MAKPKQFVALMISFVLLTAISCELSALKDQVRVGVILDLNSKVGRIAERWISKSHTDFYALYPHYRTRLALLFRNSTNDVVVAASQAVDLIKNEQVHAIIGPQRSAQAKFVINLGEKAEIPIISFSATSPFLSPTETPFFIRTTHDDSFQVRAVADIVKAYGWKEVIPIYEDTDYGNGLIPYLNDAFQAYNIRVPYRCVISLNSRGREIQNKLQTLKQRNGTTIFVVHMTASLGSKLFTQANKAGMMSEGYAWIVTEGLSSLMDPIDHKVMDPSMQGVLGLRSYIPKSKKTISKGGSINGLNQFGLWAYDTVWAVAMAVEKASAGIANPSFLKPNTSKTSVDLASLGKSEMGHKLVHILLNTKFEGLSGKFHLFKGQLEPSVFEIFNVIGETERIIGYWTQKEGLFPDLNNHNSKAMNELLKKPIWPGNTVEQPRKLRIGVPVREGFTEFIKVEFTNNPSKPHKFSGYSIEVFMAVLQVLEFPLPYKFIPYEENGKSKGSYNDLLYQIVEQKFDAVVGDTTIVANRSTFVDFTLPYSESGVSMVVLVKEDEKKNFWIFLKPFSWDLWLTTGLAFIFTGLVVWVLEHRVNTDFRGPRDHQIGTIFWFSFSTLVFAHRERVVNNWSRFVLIIWVFVVLILTQSYTASLTSMLTVQRFKPRFADVKEIHGHDYFVGYQKDSFVKELLTKQLNFDESKLKPYSTEEEYHQALSNGTVAAIFDEIPYIKLFLGKANNCSKYMMIGPTYRTDGFGFAFPQGSPLVSNISRAILNVTQNDHFSDIENKTIGGKAKCEGQGATLSSDRLSVYSFAGLFIITGAASMSSLLIYTVSFVYSQWPLLNDIHPETSTSFWSKIIYLMKNFDKKDLSAHPFNRRESRIHPAPTSPEGIELSPDINNMHNHSRIANEEAENVDRDEDEIHSPVHDDISMEAPNTSST
ncbi:hypothetical protein Dsin_018645 [Dipteronia sinensis]|uniref:Glutamate receptor n=1 Tax=Dipteronia sinensis TaxID=43782 RepID=A0AAE0E3A4_9ROSI|nr:hypothetical protein Dsin_018645 [Dipteronia sinensis]